MSLNTAHVGNGVLLHMGEFILLHCPKVTMEFNGQDQPAFRESKSGAVYLTSHRLVFINKKSEDALQSFSAPFIVLNDVELEQPIFGANYIKAKVRAQPNGNFIGEVKFKLFFKAGGAIEYGTALLRAAGMAQQNMRQGGLPFDQPPPYTPSGNWHEAPPPAYEPPPGYYGWLPAHDAFTRPQANDVFISENPPPYPGIAPPAYTPQPAPGQYGPQPGFPGQQPGFTPAEQYNPGGQGPAYPGPPGQYAQPGQNPGYYPGQDVQPGHNPGFYAPPGPYPTPGQNTGPYPTPGQNAGPYAAPGQNAGPYPTPGQFGGLAPAQNAGGPTNNSSYSQASHNNDVPSWNGFSLPPKQ